MLQRRHTGFQFILRNGAYAQPDRVLDTEELATVVCTVRRFIVHIADLIVLILFRWRQFTAVLVTTAPHYQLHTAVQGTVFGTVVGC